MEYMQSDFWFLAGVISNDLHWSQMWFQWVCMKFQRETDPLVIICTYICIYGSKGSRLRISCKTI